MSSERTEASRDAIHATDGYKRQVAAMGKLRLVYSVPEPVKEALFLARKLAMNRHTHDARGQTDPDTCARCGGNFRSAAHYRVGESERTDKEELRAALEACGIGLEWDERA